MSNWIEENADMERILNETVRRNIEENWKVFLTASETPNPALFITRLCDQVRSNSFLWMEAWLKVQERYSRVTPVSMGLSRTIVLTMVAADISVGYLSLRERAQWSPNLVGPKD